MNNPTNNEDFENIAIDDKTESERETDRKVVAKKIHFSILNPQVLETGLESEHLFDERGGRIGSAKNNDWVLTDQEGDIYAVHCEISIEDYHFCLTPISGNTYINGADSPLDRSKAAILTVNDIITIGAYRIRVNIVDSEASLDSPRYQKRDLGAFFPNDMEGEQLVPDNDTYHGEYTSRKVDPLLALSEAQNEHTKHRLTQMDQSDQSIWDSQSSIHTDFQYNLGAAMNNSVSHSSKLSAGLEASLNDIKSDGKYPGYGADAYSDHLATGPMLRGLGVTLSHSDHSGEMQYVAEEMGASLKETVLGLLKLHKQVDISRYGVMNKNFQPIEDNPLRLGLTYEETIHLMYDASVSPVHLSPPAAIHESLEMIHNHQEAMHEAISEALTQILHAFSPDALTRRFHYYRMARNIPETDRETWAWKMYKSYYLELISNRQTGFQKLFWEIFDQVYDKKMRTLQQDASMDHFDLDK